MNPAVATLLLGLLLRGSLADKDDSYYIAGTGNPNVNEQMYWKDAANVLNDLSQFSELYVDFHQCAWTWMQGMEEADNDVDENDYWYMGKIPPMGANVAFSLYGSLRNHKFMGCNKDSFINSFYTSNGFNDFATAMYYAGISGFSSYMSDDDGSSLTAKCQGGYGVGCDANGFGMHTYSTNTCDPQYFKAVTDSMSGLNQAMSKSRCVKIFDLSRYNGYTEGTPLELLSNSHSCFYQDVFSPDGECPDPYGKLAYYQEKFHKGIVESRRSDPYQVYARRRDYNDRIHKGKLMTSVSLSLFVLAALIFFWDSYAYGERVKAAREAMKKKKKARRKNKKKAASQSARESAAGSYVAHEDGTTANCSVLDSSINDVINTNPSYVDVEAPSFKKTQEEANFAQSASHDVHLGRTILFDIDGTEKKVIHQTHDIPDESPISIDESELAAATESNDEADEANEVTQEEADEADDQVHMTESLENNENKQETTPCRPRSELPPPSIESQEESGSEKQILLSRSIHSEEGVPETEKQPTEHVEPKRLDEQVAENLDISNLSADSEDYVIPEETAEKMETAVLEEADEGKETAVPEETVVDKQADHESKTNDDEKITRKKEDSKKEKVVETTDDLIEEKLIAPEEQNSLVEETTATSAKEPEQYDLDISCLSSDSVDIAAPEEPKLEIIEEQEEVKDTEAPEEHEIVQTVETANSQAEEVQAEEVQAEEVQAEEVQAEEVQAEEAQAEEVQAPVASEQDGMSISNLSPEWETLEAQEEPHETEEGVIDAELLAQILMSCSTDFDIEE